MTGKKKKKLEYMSSNEWLGDMTTHFMKSGEALRSPENRDQEALADYIPRMANGVKVEYDIAFNIPDKVCGYKFSDFLTKAVYLSPQSLNIARHNISEVAAMGATSEGKRVFEELRDGIADKYILHNDETFRCKDLVVLPGTNLLSKEDTVDMEKIDKLVQEGAYVKLHPITEKTWINFLKNRWRGKVIPADAPLYPILKNAERVWFPMSSETGMASVLLGKKIGTIDHPRKNSVSNFEHIYTGLDRAPVRARLVDKYIALLSHPESGILTTYHENPADRVAAYFRHMMKYPHKQ